MITRWQWLRAQLGRKLWTKSVGVALFGILLATLGICLSGYLPTPDFMAAQDSAAQGILNILASSMLAVTTFSLSIMVTAFSGASNVSPRATDLLMSDQTSHNILAIFVGAFLFSLAGLIALSLGLHGPREEFVLFVVAIIMVIAVVIAILRWVDHLTKFGRMGDTLNRLEAVTLCALKDRLENPFLGGSPLIDDSQIPNSHALYANDIGYVDFIDMHSLQKIAERAGCQLYLRALPGAFIHQGVALIKLDRALDEETLAALDRAFVIGRQRNFLQDPRFGVAVLAEAGSRALSSAINDTGTPIDIISRVVRIFSTLKERETARTAAIVHPAVWVPPIDLEEYFNDFFTPMARDSANLIEVHIRLHKALHALDALADPKISQCVRKARAIARDYALNQLQLDRDKQLLISIIEQPHSSVNLRISP